MLARKIVLGFGIAALLPLVVHHGIEVVGPKLDWKKYHVEDFFQRQKDATPEEKVVLQEESKKLSEQWEADSQKRARLQFFVGVPVGIALVVAGSFAAIHAVGGGVMLGGIFTFMEGCCWYWRTLDTVGRFLVLLAGLGVLLWIGYRRLSEPKQPKPSSA